MIHHGQITYSCDNPGCNKELMLQPVYILLPPHEEGWDEWTLAVCGKRQHIPMEAKHACGEGCAMQLLNEWGGVVLPMPTKKGSKK